MNSADSVSKSSTVTSRFLKRCCMPSSYALRLEATEDRLTMRP